MLDLIPTHPNMASTMSSHGGGRRAARKRAARRTGGFAQSSGKATISNSPLTVLRRFIGAEDAGHVRDSAIRRNTDQTMHFGGGCRGQGVLSNGQAGTWRRMGAQLLLQHRYRLCHPGPVSNEQLVRYNTPFETSYDIIFPPPMLDLTPKPPPNAMGRLCGLPAAHLQHELRNCSSE